MKNKDGQPVVPKYIRIRDAILDDIRSGLLLPGSRLANREELIAKYGVARATLNKALEELVDCGAVNATRKRGTFVAEPSHRELHALVYDASSLILSPGMPSAQGNTARNILNGILTQLPPTVRLLHQDSGKLADDLHELNRFGRILWLMPELPEIARIKHHRLFNCCLVNRLDPELSFISTDHRAATHDVTALLLAKVPPPVHIYYLDFTVFGGAIRNLRREGFVAACEQYDVFYKILAGDGREVLEQLLEQQLQPGRKVILVSGSRYLTGAVIRFSALRRLSLGKELFYSDFDNFDAQINFGEPMLSVIQNFGGFAQTAVEFLTAANMAMPLQRIIPHCIIGKEHYFNA